MDGPTATDGLMKIVGGYLDPKNKLDRTLYGHTKFVISKTLATFKRHGFNKRKMEETAKMLLRFYRVVRLYQDKRKGYTLGETINLIDTTVKTFMGG